MPHSVPKKQAEAALVPSKSAPHAMDAADVLQGNKQVVIRHAGEEYRLIVTRNNRLILQK